MHRVKDQRDEISSTNMAVLATKPTIFKYLVFHPTSAETGRGYTSVNKSIYSTMFLYQKVTQ